MASVASQMLEEVTAHAQMVLTSRITYVYCVICWLYINKITIGVYVDRLCGLVVGVSGYRYSGPGFDPRRYQIF